MHQPHQGQILNYCVSTKSMVVKVVNKIQQRSIKIKGVLVLLLWKALFIRIVYLREKGIFILPHPKPHLACYVPVNSNVYPSSSKIPKQFTDVLYGEVKKLCVLIFFSKYLLLHFNTQLISLSNSLRFDENMVFL